MVLGEPHTDADLVLHHYFGKRLCLRHFVVLELEITKKELIRLQSKEHMLKSGFYYTEFTTSQSRQVLGRAPDSP